MILEQAPRFNFVWLLRFKDSRPFNMSGFEKGNTTVTILKQILSLALVGYNQDEILRVAEKIATHFNQELEIA